MFLCQIEIIFAFKSSVLLKAFVQTIFLSSLHKFSIGFKSGDWGGQSRVLQPRRSMKPFTVFDRWHGAPTSWG